MAVLCERNCGNCFYVVANKDAIEKLDTTQPAIAEEAMSDEYEHVLADAVARGETTGTPFEGMTVEDLAARSRKGAAFAIELIDEARERTIISTNKLTAGCPGPKKARFNAFGQMITAQFCNSPQAPTHGDIEHVQVTREPAAE